MLAFLLVVSITAAQTIYSTNYKIPYSAIDSGGGNISSGSYFLEVSTEPIGGNSSSSSYGVCIGINCCPSDVEAKFINTTTDEVNNEVTITFALWHSDICMGTTNVTVQCAAGCNPCTDSCTNYETRHTLTLTDVLTARNVVSITNPNISNVVYCKVIDDTFSLQRCFGSPTNLTVTVEAGGPYTGTSATAIVAGNVTYDEGTAIRGANVTIDLFAESDLASRLDRVITNTSETGKYSATFTNLGAPAYRVNVTARYQSLRANITDIFNVVSIHGNCQTKTINLRGRALDATTGEEIPSGTASLTIEKTGDKKDVAVVSGVWSANMVTCLISGGQYTVTVKITDNNGKVSWSEIMFTAP